MVELYIAISTNDVITQNLIKKTIDSIKEKDNMDLIVNTYNQLEPLLYMLTTDIVHYDMVILFEWDSVSDQISKIRKINIDVRLLLVINKPELLYDLFKYNISGFVLNKDVVDCLGSVVLQLLHTSALYDRRYFPFDIIALNGTCYKQKIALLDILYISVKDKIVTLHTNTEVSILKEIKLENIAREMTKRGFIYINRSHIVNISRIKKFSDKTIVLDNDEVLEMSRRQQKNVELAFINHYINNRKEEIV